MHVQIEADKLKKIANYVASAQDIIREYSAIKEAVATKAPGVVDKLVEQGLVSPHLKEAKLQELTDSPATAMDVLVTTAEHVKAASVGEADASMKAAATEKSSDEVFVDRLIG